MVLMNEEHKKMRERVDFCQRLLKWTARFEIEEEEDRHKERMDKIKQRFGNFLYLACF